MARIGKADHATIFRLIDTDHRKVADVAAEYGCSPGTIYALIGKLRQAATSRLPAPTPLADTASVTPAPASAAGAGVDLFAATAAAEIGPMHPKAAEPGSRADLPRTPPPDAPNRRGEAVVTALPRRRSADAVGAAKAKPGVGLTMRTPDGEESLTPFRSLEDLLSAVKPILRASARSAEAVWFCIQPVDLASLDSDAA